MTARLLNSGQQPLALEPACIVKNVPAGEGPDLATFGALPGVRYFCFGSDAYHHAGEIRQPAEPLASFAAVARDGAVVALARIVAREMAQHLGELTLAIQAPYENDALIAELLASLVAGARARGISRLVTAVPRERIDPFPRFREAGMHTVSWFNIGGVTEVVLDID